VDERFSPIIERELLKEEAGFFKKSAHLQIYLPEQLPCFVGHFPDYPLVPAYVQLEWMRQFSVRYFAICGNVKKVQRSKFLSPLLPGHRFEVDLSVESRELLEVEFSITEQSESHGSTQICTKGSLHFERLA
jgi:3-hydroxymyristoyl/3-hydroxydecanoyl-(acyl carrier protein) dehydratase